MIGIFKLVLNQNRTNESALLGNGDISTLDDVLAKHALHQMGFIFPRRDSWVKPAFLDERDQRQTSSVWAS